MGGLLTDGPIAAGLNCVLLKADKFIKIMEKLGIPRILRSLERLLECSNKLGKPGSSLSWKAEVNSINRQALLSRHFNEYRRFAREFFAQYHRAKTRRAG
jgi:hypothetical protein